MTARPEDMVLLTTCANEMEAELIAGALRGQGVAAAAVGCIPATVLGPYTGNNDPARVVVRRDQLEQARTMLDELLPPPIPIDAARAGESDEAPPRRGSIVMRLGRVFVILVCAGIALAILLHTLTFVSMLGFGDPDGPVWAWAATVAFGIAILVLIPAMCIAIVWHLVKSARKRGD